MREVEAKWPVSDSLAILVGLLIVFLEIRGGFSPQIASFLLTFGGAVLGAALSSFSQVFSTHNLKNHLANLLSRRFRSEPAKIASIREKFVNGWHQYYVTETIGGERCWRYTYTNFTSTTEDEHLLGVEIFHNEGKSYFYQVEAALRGESIIFVETPQGRSDHGACIVVVMKTAYHMDVFCGISFHPTWRNTGNVAPCFICRDPLPHVSFSDDVIAQEHFAALDERWKNMMRDHHITLSLP